MKRLVMLVVAGMMAMVLGACGENAPKKPEEAKTEMAAEQTQNQEQQAAPAVNEEAPVVNEAPAE